MRDNKLQAFADKRHRAFNLLEKIGTLPNLEAPLGEQARQLAQACLKNLTEPQFFEPPENIAPIINFYIQTHPQTTYEAFKETLDYLETCYEGGLEGHQNYRELRQSLQSKLHPQSQAQ